MNELSKHETDLVSGGDDTGPKDPPSVPEIPQTRTAGTTPDPGALCPDKQ
jgi:hypothetical protein